MGGTYERIKDLCKKNNITVSKLEHQLGYSNGSISKSNFSLSNKRLLEIADYFGVTIDYLMKGDEAENKYYINRETADIAQELLENPEYRILFDAPKNLQPEDLNIVISMIKTLQKKEKGE